MRAGGTECWIGPPVGRTVGVNHDEAPLVEALADYHKLGRYGFTPPGHRQGVGVDPRVAAVLGAEAFRSDVLASAGLDDRSSSNGYLKRAEELMADAVGADHAFFSTCGSSLSVKAAMLAVAGGKGELLVGRDAHKSVVAGLIFSGVQPRWVPPRWDRELHLSHAPSPEAVEDTWRRYPDAAGALVVSPTPYGTAADIGAIAEVCHERGKPLIVDEAWGAHLPFHEDLPTWAMNAGADVCVVSVHKMGAGFEQGSVFHVQGDLVDPSHISACADLLMTTSPNVLIYSAMDGWRRQMVQHGHELLGAALELATRLRARIDDMPGLHVLDKELLARRGLRRPGPSADPHQRRGPGHQRVPGRRLAARQPAGRHRPQRPPRASWPPSRWPTTTRPASGCSARSKRWSRRLRAAPNRAGSTCPIRPVCKLDSVDLPRDAFFAAAEAVPLAEAVGRVAAEQITPYPPGIPAVVPGERLTAEVLDYLRTGLQAGMVLPDPADPTLATIRVTAG